MTNETAQSIWVTAPPDTVAATMPRDLTVDGATLSLTAATSEPGHVRFEGTWRAGRAGGPARIEVRPISPTASQLDVVLEDTHRRRYRGPVAARRRAAATVALASAISGTLEGRDVAPRPPARGGRRSRMPRVLVPATVVLALAAVVAGTLMGPPKPVSLDTATARYRQTVAAPTAAPVVETSPAAASSHQSATTADAGADAAAPQPARTQVARAGARRTGGDAPPQRPASAPEPSGPGDDEAPRREAGASASPEPGVYRYATDGWEELDMPRGHRRFPDETTQTVIATDCGHRLRWDPMEERWDETELCLQEDRHVPVQYRTYRSFFGRSVEQHFTCRPMRAPAGAAWANRCRSDDTTMTNVAYPAGRRRMGVDGERVAVAGLRIETEMTGANRGTREAVMWHGRNSGVLVHSEVSADVEVEGPFGTVHYREQYTLHLASLRAHR